MSAPGSREILRLATALERAWAADTSAYDDWAPSAAARGQCAVTALVIQDRLGGEIVRAVLPEGSHYWNRLPDGTDVDLTRVQFSVFEPKETAISTREYVLSSPSTRHRYEILRQRVLEQVSELV